MCMTALAVVLDAAETAYEEAVRLEQRNPRALNNLGACLLRRGEARRAAALFRAAIDADPTYEPARRNLDALRRSN